MGTRGEFRRIAIYLFLITSSTGFLQPFLPLYIEANGLSHSQFGIVTGLGAGLALFIQPWLGRLSDRLDARRPFIFGSAATAALAYFAFPYARGVPQFFVLVAVGANGTMYLSAAGGVLVGRLVEATKGGAAYAGLRVWGSVGYILTSLTTGYLISRKTTGALGRLALNPIFRFGPIMFVVIAALALGLPDRKSTSPPSVSGDRAPLPPNLRRFLYAYFFYILALYGASNFLSLYLKSLGASGLGITATFAAGVVVEVLVMRWSGRFSDRFGRRPALAITFMLLPIRLLLYVPATGPLWVLAVQSLHGLNFGIMGAVAVVFVNDLATERTRGHAQSRLFAVAGLAGVVGPIIFGAAAQITSLAAMFGFAAIFAAIGAAIFVTGVEDSHRTSESIADKAPASLRPFLRWLDSPTRR